MLALLRRNPSFARLWMSQVVSQAGDWMNRLACLVLIGKLGGNTGALGAFFGLELVLRVLPPALLGPLAGPLADRISRRLMMVVADLLRALIVVGFLFVDAPGDLTLLYGLIFLQMATSVFFDIARTAALPDTVSAAELYDAHTLSAATWSVVLSVGAMLSGLLVSGVGVKGAFIVDAGSYIVSAMLLMGMPLPAPKPDGASLHWRELLRFTELRRGWTHARDLGLGAVVWVKTLWGAAGGFIVVLSLAGPARFGETGDLGANANATGALYSARGVGTLIGPFLLRRFLGRDDRGLRRQILAGFAIAAVGYGAFGFTEHLGLACLAVAFAHIGGSGVWVASTVLWQRHVGDSFRGRVFAVEYLGLSLSLALFGTLAGIVFDTTHSLPITVWSCSGTVVVLVAIWAYVTRDMRGPVTAVPVAAAVFESDV